MHSASSSFEFSQAIEQRLRDHLAFLYGDARASTIYRQLSERLARFYLQYPVLSEKSPSERLTEQDVILITYGDQIQSPDKDPLLDLAEVLSATIEGLITYVHILPFFPYSSDDGFSVIDYTRVNPDMGNWDDVARLREHFHLMFDLVVNHISSQSNWFKAFLRGDPAYADAFIVVDPNTDISDVVRPRALPLLTPVQMASGEEKLVWTTFSSDQIDLNFADPEVLLRMIDVLLLYVARGAEIIRLDAIAYLWKTIGTPCIHLEETHRVVQLFRTVLDAVAPGVVLITETNVPHEENVSYFGDGANEAQLVYQFPLPPLVLHAIVKGDAQVLSAWASTLEVPSPQVTFYNFLASHDGVGVRPLEGILPSEDVALLADRVRAHGGHVSYKTNADGSKSVYELNVSYFDALSDPQGEEPLDLQVQRFMVSQAIMLAIQGVPAIYVHSLFGSRNDNEGVARTGRPRSINREKFRRSELETALADPNSLRARVFNAYRHFLTVRRQHRAFHPNGAQRVLTLHPALFSVIRTAPDGAESLFCLHNVAQESFTVRVDFQDLGVMCGYEICDLLTRACYTIVDGVLTLHIAPYQVLWLAL